MTIYPDQLICQQIKEEHVGDLRFLQQYWWEYGSPEVWCSVTERNVWMFCRISYHHLQGFLDLLTLEYEGTSTIHQIFRNQTPNNTVLHLRKYKSSRPYWRNTNAVAKVLVMYFFNEPSCTGYSANSWWIVSAYFQVIIRPVHCLGHMKNLYYVYKFGKALIPLIYLL